MTPVLAVLVEAWSELRVHKTRILLALLGVALSVAALTSVVALGNMAREGMVQNAERDGGRTATLTIYVDPGAGMVPAGGPAASGAGTGSVQAVFDDIVERYRVRHASSHVTTGAAFQFPDGVRQVTTHVVDPDYGAMHRLGLAAGHWFTADDGERLAPAVVVNEAFHRLLGSPDLTRDPGVRIAGARPVDGVMVGVVRDRYPQVMPEAMILTPHAERWGIGDATGTPSLELWVPEEIAEPLSLALNDELTARFPGQAVGVNRTDYAAWGDPFAGVQLAIGGIAGMVLLLGAVGLLNISLVTVKYRVREIGIRRSFGATSGRIFFGVMLESVVGTFVAGVAGVMLSIAVVKSPWIVDLMAQGLTDVPAFPLEAALIGVGAATAVGALAGIFPALVAVRVKVIDAIRY